MVKGIPSNLAVLPSGNIICSFCVLWQARWLICSEQVHQILTKWIEMVTENGIWEHYNPETGKGYGAEGLGMSCLIVDWMARLGIVEVQKA